MGRLAFLYQRFELLQCILRAAGLGAVDHDHRRVGLKALVNHLGHHRAEAAFLLVALQDLGNHRDDERQLRYARLLQQLEPDGERLRDVRQALEGKGLSSF